MNVVFDMFFNVLDRFFNIQIMGTSLYSYIITLTIIIFVFKIIKALATGNSSTKESGEK